MSLSTCYIINPFDLCDYPQKPPARPAERRTLWIEKNIGTHRRRKTRLETQGRANRRVWRAYLRNDEPGSLWSFTEKHHRFFTHLFEAKMFAEPKTSLYDFVMRS